MYGKMLWKMRTFPNRGDIIHNMLILLESMFGPMSRFSTS